MSIFEFNWDLFAAPGCSFNMDYYAKWLLNAATPFMALLMVLLQLVFHAARKGHAPDRDEIIALQINKTFRTVLLLVNLLYTSFVQISIEVRAACQPVSLLYLYVSSVGCAASSGLSCACLWVLCMHVECVVERIVLWVLYV